MNITLTILLIEVTIVLAGMCAFLFYLGWKRKKSTVSEFETLLENVSNQESERKAYLIKHLQEGYAINDGEAEESSEYMVEAEKQFLQQFMKQQIERSSVASFHQNLCELLDQYLYFVPKNRNVGGAEVEQIEANEVAPAQEEQQVDLEKNHEVNQNDVSALENGVEEGENTEKVADSTTSEEEPDWGDAFAESGEEMDDDVKAGYESEQ